MDIVSRQALTAVVRDRYWRADRKNKKQILDEFVANTGYHRKYALALLHKPSRPPASCSRRRRTRTYTQEVADALIFIWQVCNHIGPRRLQPFLQEIVPALERHGELTLTASTRQLLLTISISTVDRLLKPARRRLTPHGRCTTKPGTLLKKLIPIRTWADWDDAKPGFLEIDLVAHCGDSSAGEYLETLNAVDVATGWCECIVPRNQGQQAVFAALVEIRQRLPVPLLGIDADNDAAFINNHLQRYCAQEGLTFTRGRAYQKNDQAHVEGKNWTVVRQFVGYDRYEGDLARLELNALYKDVRLYVNFFQPVRKLKEKARVDGKIKKVYDTAQTPCQRVLASAHVKEENKQKLREIYPTLNPVKLYAAIQKQLDHLWQVHAIRYRPE